MIKQEKCRIIENNEVAESHFKLTFESEEIAQQSKPMQFVNVRVTDGLDPLLRKPFGIYDINQKAVSIMYKVVGKGTSLLSKRRAGELIDILGPLGNTVDINNSSDHTALIAGGIGIAAIKLLSEKLDSSFDLFYGVNSEKELLEIDKWKQKAKNIYLSSNDGSVGDKGFITDIFAKQPEKYKRIFCCGPNIMMQKIYETCSAASVEIDSNFILEEYMACGFGICMGCVVKTKSGFKRVCKEGPVFKGQDIKW